MKSAPLHFHFGPRNTDAEHAAMTTRQDAYRDEHRGITHGAINSHLFVASIQNQVLYRCDGPVSPCIEFVIEQRGGSTHLRAGDVEATQLGGDLGHLSR